MSNIAINPVTRRVQFTGNTGTGPYAFTFNILVDGDIAVFKGTTELTLTTDYTVSINANGTGSVTLTVALIASDVLTIIGGRELSRTTDFVTAGDLLASSLNEQLDSNVIMTQQLDEKLGRGLFVNPGDVFTDLELPLKDDRKGTVLGFNATTGDPEPGPEIADVDSLANISADIKTLAEIQDGTVATDAITNVNTIRTDVTTVSGISGNVSTVAGISADVTTVAADGADIGTVAGISSDVTTVSGISGNVTSVAGNASNINTVAADGADIGTVATSITNVNTVATDIANVNTNATNIASINTNATNITDIQNASANAASALASKNAAATSATNSANSATASETSRVASVAAQAAAETAETNAETAQTAAEAAQTAAETAETNAATSETNAANSAASASTDAGTATTKAGEAATSATSAASSASSAQASKDAALAALDSFDDRYLGQKTADPTVDNDGDALVSGALYFNTTDDIMKVYDGSLWVAAYASLSGAMFGANNLSDVASISASRTTLGLGTGDTPTFAGINTTGNLSFGDNDKAIFGAGSDLQIYSNNNQSFITESNATGSLFINASNLVLRNTSGEYYLYGNSDGAVNLYHDNAQKLATTSTGVDITGTLTSDGLTVDGGTIKLDGNYPVGTANVALGDQALSSGSFSGNYNTSVGRMSMLSNTTGSNNVAIGSNTLDANTTGNYNTTVGDFALTTATTASYNVAIGSIALRQTTTGQYNTAVGSEALRSNTTASNNTAVGYKAAYSNTTGYENVALGLESLLTNSTGVRNTATGRDSLRLNTTGSYNVANGMEALRSNTTASNNTAVGYQAGYNNTTGTNVVAVGTNAGYSNTVNGYSCYVGTNAGLNTTGSENQFFGKEAGYYVTTGSKNTILGGYNGNQGGLDIRTSSNNIVLSDGDGNPRALIDGSGNFVINNSAELGAKLTVVQTSASQSGGRFEQSAANQSTYNVWSTFTSSGNINTTAVHFAGYTESGNRFIVYGNGNVVNTNNSYGSTSDVKLKENIVDSGSQWDDIKALTVRKYSMKSDNLDAPNMLGVVAQEVEAAGMSGLVFESPDRDADNNDLGTVTKQVNYSILYMKAVKALQEAMDRIETLEADVAALKNP